ncbi:MAG: hypothetical protein R2726_03390 [Acidimicrobiales bacterium]
MTTSRCAIGGAIGDGGGRASENARNTSLVLRSSLARRRCPGLVPTLAAPGAPMV